jgi:hypothetical protein
LSSSGLAPVQQGATTAAGTGSHDATAANNTEKNGVTTTGEGRVRDNGRIPDKTVQKNVIETSGVGDTRDLDSHSGTQTAKTDVTAVGGGGEDSSHGDPIATPNSSSSDGGIAGDNGLTLAKNVKHNNDASAGNDDDDHSSTVKQDAAAAAAAASDGSGKSDGGLGVILEVVDETGQSNHKKSGGVPSRANVDRSDPLNHWQEVDNRKHVRLSQEELEKASQHTGTAAATKNNARAGTEEKEDPKQDKKVKAHRNWTVLKQKLTTKTQKRQSTEDTETNRQDIRKKQAVKNWGVLKQRLVKPIGDEIQATESKTAAHISGEKHVGADSENGQDGGQRQKENVGGVDVRTNLSETKDNPQQQKVDEKSGAAGNRGERNRLGEGGPGGSLAPTTPKGQRGKNGKGADTPRDGASKRGILASSRSPKMDRSPRRAKKDSTAADKTDGPQSNSASRPSSTRSPSAKRSDRKDVKSVDSRNGEKRTAGGEPAEKQIPEKLTTDTAHTAMEGEGKAQPNGQVKTGRGAGHGKEVEARLLSKEEEEELQKAHALFGKAVMRKVANMQAAVDKTRGGDHPQQGDVLNSSARAASLNSSGGARSLSESGGGGRPAHKTTSMQSLTVPGAALGSTPPVPEDALGEMVAGGDLSRRDSTRHTPDSTLSRKSVDLRVHHGAGATPGAGEEKPKPMMHDDSLMRAAVPYLPVPLAVLCLILNILIPGTGK